MKNESKLPGGALPLIALCHEYCQLLEQPHAAADDDAKEFVRRVLGLLARVYITALDLDASAWEPAELNEALDEEEYNAVRESLAEVLGENDTYLDTFSDDMKYSDTPVAASISEQLADLYQVFFNFTSTVRELPASLIPSTLAEFIELFDTYWSETLCNALRALNAIRKL